MTKELATVVTSVKGIVTVTSQIKSTCGSCNQVKTCGSGQVAQALPQPRLTLTLPYDVELIGRELTSGDCVVLSIPEKDMLLSSAQVYLLPLFGLIGFSAVGQWLFKQHILPHELIALLLGLLGGYGGHKLAKYIQLHGGNNGNLQPKIIEVLPEKSL